eukprot:c17662_g1_i4.p1 GENE.c17662_g1_i4~~c17662_g1_i4.p1  ORF type:complete len:160 (+),score=30.88 c17662_g1_i4:634-1113(+)
MCFFFPPSSFCCCCVSEDADYLTIFVRPEHHGWLKKEGKLRKWKRRWFRLTNNMLFYFDDPQTEVPLGTYPLTDVTVSTLRGYKSRAFHISPLAPSTKLKVAKPGPKGMTYHLYQSVVLMAETTEERDAWISEIQKTILLSAAPTPQQHSNQTAANGAV